MKKIYLVLGITFWLQSCVSYKSVEINPKTMVIGEQYKIERSNHKTTKAIYVRNADSAIVVMKNGVEEQIPLKDINKAGQRKFSLFKSVLWYPIAVVGLAIIFLYAGA